jgi:hypothetical protein
MSEENKQSRKARNAELKAKYEAEKAEKKAKREAKRAGRSEKAHVEENSDEPTHQTSDADAASSTSVSTPVLAVEDVRPDVTWETVAVTENEGAWDVAARGSTSAWEQAVENPEPTRREQREEKKAQKLEAELSKPGKKRRTRNGLPPEVSKLLMEKKLILAQWRSRKIDPNQAVERLSALVATCADGTTWRLLPRPGGAALVKTREDGSTEIVEPPQRRRPLVTLLIAVLFGAFVAIAIWSSFDPVTSGGSGSSVSTPASSSSVVPGP